MATNWHPHSAFFSLLSTSDESRAVKETDEAGAREEEEEMGASLAGNKTELPSKCEKTEGLS